MHLLISKNRLNNGLDPILCPSKSNSIIKTKETVIEAIASQNFNQHPSLPDSYVFSEVDPAVDPRAQSQSSGPLESTSNPWVIDPVVDNAFEAILLKFIRGETPTFCELKAHTSLLKAIIWKKNDVISKSTRDFVQKCLLSIHAQVCEKTLNDEQSFHMEVMIGDMLSLVPFLSPIKDEKLQVPLRINERWVLGQYLIEPIALTPLLLGSPIMAYGLNPINKESLYPPFLLFKGTTFPSDDGCMLSLLTDVNPFASIGSYAFKIGKKKIGRWLEDQTTEDIKAIIVGKSLGGALGKETTLSYPDKVAKQMPYGSSGFTVKQLKRVKYLYEMNRLPKFYNFCQKNDPVPYFDWVSTVGIEYYEITGECERKGVWAHVDMYSTHRNSKVMKIHAFAKQKRFKRIVLTLLRDTICAIAFPLLLLLHVLGQAARYVFIPSFKFLKWSYCR